MSVMPRRPENARESSSCRWSPAGWQPGALALQIGFVAVDLRLEIASAASCTRSRVSVISAKSAAALSESKLRKIRIRVQLDQDRAA